MDLLISVIIPVYNAEKYLTKNVESLINQTYHNFEAIYVNDSSSDTSLDILMNYQEKDSRIKVFSKEKEGTGSARNFGVEKACGDYLLFLDADDFYAPDAFDKLVKTVEMYREVEVIIFKCKYYNHNTKSVLPEGMDMSLFPKNKMFACRDLANDFFQIYVPNIWMHMYRIDIVKNSSVKCLNSVAEDMVYAMLLMIKCTKIVALDEYLYYYRCNNSDSAWKRHYREKDSVVFSVLYLKQALDHLKEYEYYKNSFWKMMIPWLYEECVLASDLSGFSYNFNVIAAFFKQCFCTKEFVKSICDEESYWMFCELTELSEMEFLVRYRKFYGEYRKRCIAPYSFDLLHKHIIEGKRLVLYGAGCVGKYYYTQLTSEVRCDVVAWVDGNYEKFIDSALNIQSMDSIQDIEYDFILIAVFEERTAKEIHQFLRNKWEIADDKILWFQPVYLR